MAVVTVAQAAAALGVSTRRVRQLLGEGRVKGATKMGRDWLIPATKDGQPKLTLRPPGRPSR